MQEQGACDTLMAHYHLNAPFFQCVTNNQSTIHLDPDLSFHNNETQVHNFSVKFPFPNIP